MIKKAFLFFTLMLFIWSCSVEKQESESIENGVSLEMANYRKSVLKDINYKLEFKIPRDFESKIQALENLTFSLTDNSQDILLDFKATKENLKEILVNGKSQPLEVVNEHIILKSENLQKGFNNVEINFWAGETSLNRKEDFLYTLFVPDRARTAFPCFDQPNLKATFDLTLDIPQDWNAISNAPEASSELTDGRKNIIYDRSDLISTYLFSFVTGDFETVTATSNGRTFTMLHRETDSAKVARNKDLIFDLHSSSVKWLEEYTGIDYPFKKLGFALIPSFQYGGMEHVGAIQYRANSLFLDEDPSQSRLLGRASLIAHEVAHMWFGNLVTMDWFNDVWTKEVFANFMAAKMVNPSFPEINHDLNFLLRHYPSAYGVDRTEGANPIRQELLNLNEAGQMYGPIIYNKAPIMMRQLESLLGERVFQEGLQEYLTEFGMNNATWPNLINILDQKVEVDLKRWSEVWVNTPGRPVFQMNKVQDESGVHIGLDQRDMMNAGRSWPQAFKMELFNQNNDQKKQFQVVSADQTFNTDLNDEWQSFYRLMNSDGMGYGLFPADPELLTTKWSKLNELQKGVQLINMYENLLEPTNLDEAGQLNPTEYLELLKWVLIREENQLIINRALSQLSTVYWSLLSDDQRQNVAPELEKTLLYCLNELHNDVSIKKTFYNSFKNIAQTDGSIGMLYEVWLNNNSQSVFGVKLSENDKIGLASDLAKLIPEKAEEIVKVQMENIQNPDSKKRFEFVAPTLSNDKSERDEFFESLAEEKNRETESWVLGALSNLHHPLRREQALDYIKPSLELLQEIQQTGDIFFPSRWLGQTLGSHNTAQVVEIVQDFLEDNPEYNAQLKMKILQSVDMAKRSSEIIQKTAKK